MLIICLIDCPLRYNSFQSQIIGGLHLLLFLILLFFIIEPSITEPISLNENRSQPLNDAIKLLTHHRLTQRSLVSIYQLHLLVKLIFEQNIVTASYLKQ